MRVQKIDSMHLADWREVGASAVFVFAVGSYQDRTVAFVDRGGELAADINLVGEDHLAAVQADRHQPQRNLAFYLIGRGEDRRSRRGVWCGEEVQAHAPEPARMAAGVSVLAYGLLRLT